MTNSYYQITNVTYCFPYKTACYLKNRFNKNCLLETNLDLLGVLAPYVNKEMTEQEADEFICEIIKGHPYMKDAMNITIDIDCFSKQGVSLYHTMTIKNDNYKKERKEYVATPIKWREKSLDNHN